MTLPILHQSPRDPEFVQSPYGFYARARAAGPLVYWEDYAMPCATSHTLVSSLLRDRRFGREVPEHKRPAVPEHLKPFYAIEEHSLLEQEPPSHTRLRRLVLRAFTSRRIMGLRPEIEALCHQLIDRFDGPEVDLIPTFAEALPVIVIARLIGVPEERAPDLLRWSHDMVAMYQARRDHGVELAAGQAAADFTAYLQELIAERRKAPADDLLSELIAARDGTEQLSDAEMIATTVLLLNAGHEATVHTIGNGVRLLLQSGVSADGLDPDLLTEEILRIDPPLHMFTRYATEDVEVEGHLFRTGDEVALLLASANHDESAFDAPERFNPGRLRNPHVSFGAGVHFCVGAPLARAEAQLALPILFRRHPKLALAGPALFADRYHFHGLESLPVRL
ncbi:cytochrome P450 [Oceanibium sediminis]|uniref:cytochrome P450 n=1 Tax=Oceanibium sediminis TaxID=2026339 RepID=UPI00280A782D|nr:cytochrome P450 [Oceanibium sediminis]